MSRRVLSLGLVIACLIASILVSSRASAKTWNYQSHSQTASMYYSHFEPDPNPPPTRTPAPTATPGPYPYPYPEPGTQSYPAPPAPVCGTYQYVSVFAREGDTGSAIYPQPGPPERTLFVSAGIFDTCTGTSHFWGWGSTNELPAAAFKLDGALNQASLVTTLTMYDEVSRTQLPVTLNLTWTGSGERFSGNFHYDYQNRWYTFVTNGHGKSRYATFSGDVSFGSRTWQGLSGTGYLTQSTYMSVSVTHD